MPAGRTPGRADVGIGLRTAHHQQVLERRPALGFVEVHSENFMAGGAPLAFLERVRAEYAVSLHGVGLSLGSADPIDERHLDRLVALARRVEPALVSEHLCWCSIDGRYANELLPLPFTLEAAAHVASRIAQVQDRLGRTLLVENVSAYHAFADSEMREWEFVAEVARRCGCAILLDVSNIQVNAANFGFDARDYLACIDAASVGQFHLGGFERRGAMLVDTHGARVAAEAWALYREAVARIGPRPTIVEWDTQLPALDVLLGEASAARAIAEARAAAPVAA